MSKHFIVYILIFCAIQIALASNTTIFHNELEPVVIGDDAQFEYSLIGLDFDIYEARLFYRSKGESDFKSIILDQQGYTLSSKLQTKGMTTGTIEYYLAMQTLSGEVITFPEINPSQNPNTFKLVASSAAAAFQNIENVLLLSPDPNEVVPEDELIVAISIPNENADVDHSKTRLLIDGINVSNLMERDENVYVFAPASMRTGPHNVEFKIFSPDGSLLAKEEFTFRISSSTTNVGQFTQSTNVFFDDRFQNISENSDNFFRGGFTWNARYSGWDFKLKGLVSTDDGFSSQNPNRFGALVAYNFNPKTNIYLKGGDFSGDYDQLTFWNRRILGVGVGINSNWVDFDFSYGQSASAVDSSKFSLGRYSESFLAIRPVIHFGEYVDWGLNLINGQEDPASAKGAANPRESLVIGSTLKMNFDNSRIRFLGSFQASMINNDASTEIKFDDLADSLDITGSEKDIAELFVSLADPFLTISPGLALKPGLAMKFDTYLNYFNNYLKITYKNIDPAYRTAGNPYLLKGLRGIFINDNIRLVNNQLFLNLYLNIYEDNLTQEDAIVDNNDIGATISFFPIEKSYPGVTLSYGQQSRKNNFTLDDSDGYYEPASDPFYPEDNTMQRLSVSTNYSFATGPVNNTAIVSVSSINREDNVKRRTVVSPDETIINTNNSEFLITSLAVKNKYTIPLITRFGFSQSSSLLGKGGSPETETKNDIFRYYGGLEYKIVKFASEIDLKPFVNFALSQIDNAIDDYNRLNYTAGFYVNSGLYGNLSLRFDYIDYGDLRDFSDSIFSTRYDVTF